MKILFWILVAYVTFDIAACVYVIYRRGGINAVIAEVRQNLCYVRDEEDEDDVHDKW